MDIHSLKYVSNSYALRMLSLVYFGPLVPSIRFGDLLGGWMSLCTGVVWKLPHAHGSRRPWQVRSPILSDPLPSFSLFVVVQIHVVAGWKWVPWRSIVPASTNLLE